jgi:demethylmenaquinone methyltransferase/2-methoxy-6-polyprenyl-1,4-benzoquinol methylase
VTAVLGDATAMPFEDASFDGVILVDALHHIAEQGAAVEEIARVTRPGAIVLVAERDPRFVRAWLTCLFERLIGEPATALTPDGVVELFAGAGVPGTCSTRGGDSYRFLGVRDAHLRPHP